jgi:hypothetical protein
MEKQKLTLTADKLKEIYTNEEFRNGVAYAHQCCDQHGNFKHFETCTYPVRFIVTVEQIEEAKREIETAKAKLLKYMISNPSVFMFVGMGCKYPERYADDLCNHRIRAEFKNAVGHKYFIEVGTAQGDKMRVDHSVDRDLEEQMNNRLIALFEERDRVKQYSAAWHKCCELINENLKQPYYNFAGLERGMYAEYTKTKLLKMINEKFGCFFTSIEVDNHTLTTDDYSNISPKNRLTDEA